MFKKAIMKIIVLASIIVMLVGIVGIICSIYLSVGHVKANTVGNAVRTTNKYESKKVSNFYYILSMGDSIANGTGDESGKGFANYYAEFYKNATSKNVNVNNIAVNGDVSDGLLQIVRNKGTKPIIESAKVIFISIGGNEIKQFASSNYVAGDNSVKTVENHYLSNLTNILKIIRNENKGCTIVFIGLYNPFGEELTQDKLETLEEWNYETQKLVQEDSNSVYIPTYDLFQYNIKKYLTIDNFHPNSEGYKAIAERIEEDLKGR